jgi:hypothetical protein
MVRAVRASQAAAKKGVRKSASAFAELEDGRIWVSGGETIEENVRAPRIANGTSELWDAKYDAWAPGPVLLKARADHFAVRLSSGRIVVGGGRDVEGERISDTEIWEPRLERAARGKAMIASRERASAIALRDGRALVIGGDVSVSSGATTEILSDRTEDQREGPLLTGISEGFGVAVLQDGRVFVAGGTSRAAWAADEGVHYRPDPVRATRIYVPADNRWITGTDMITARMQHGLVVLHDGRVLSAGGLNAGAHLASSEIWDWRSEVWEESGAMACGRAEHAISVLPDGRVFVSGGSSADGIRKETELWDPDTGIFSAGPELLEPRIGHTSTVMLDGRVIISGGSGRGGVLSSCEILAP